MATLFFQYLAVYSNENPNLPNSKNLPDYVQDCVWNTK